MKSLEKQATAESRELFALYMYYVLYVYMYICRRPKSETNGMSKSDM